MLVSKKGEPLCWNIEVDFIVDFRLVITEKGK